ncbi:MAG: molybdate ABC transporter substrate-binding protein [Carboxydocellales bacterium]
MTGRLQSKIIIKLHSKMHSKIISRLKLSSIIIGILLFTNLSGCNFAQNGSPQPKKITVSAAISLKEALTDLQIIYQTSNPGLKVDINYGSSGALQQQIEQGAPVDLFISAGQQQMNALEKQGLLVRYSRKDLLGNRLVLVAAKDKSGQIKGFTDLSGEQIGKISIGNPETVPAGKYAQQTLNQLGLWEKLQDKLVLAKDVRQVITYVDTGNVDAGLVYESDARALKSGVKVATAPQNSHQPIIYPAALLKNSQAAEQAGAFLNFLAGRSAAEVFSHYGFKPLMDK